MSLTYNISAQISAAPCLGHAVGIFSLHALDISTALYMSAETSLYVVGFTQVVAWFGRGEKTTASPYR